MSAVVKSFLGLATLIYYSHQASHMRVNGLCALWLTGNLSSAYYLPGSNRPPQIH